MEQQNVGEGGFSFFGVKGREVNAGIDERLIGGCEDRERPLALQRLDQFGL